LDGGFLRESLTMLGKYANCPIAEAVCEFRLTSETKWDPTIPGFLYEKVKEQFPNKEQKLIQEISITQNAHGVRQRVQPSERAFFLATDRKTFMQVGPHLLAVNRLKPYAGWEVFKPKIEDAFRALATVVETKGLQRIGLRYINRIEIPGHSVNLGEYFEFRPFRGQSLPQKNMTSFLVGCILSFADGRDACRLELTNAVPEKAENVSFVLDLDYFLNQPRAVSEDQALEWVESAHQRIDELFEGCITDKLRKLFQEVT